MAVYCSCLASDDGKQTKPEVNLAWPRGLEMKVANIETVHEQTSGKQTTNPGEERASLVLHGMHWVCSTSHTERFRNENATKNHLGLLS